MNDKGRKRRVEEGGKEEGRKGALSTFPNAPSLLAHFLSDIISSYFNRGPQHLDFLN